MKLRTNAVEFLCIFRLPFAVIYLFLIISLPKRSLKTNIKVFWDVTQWGIINSCWSLHKLEFLDYPEYRGEILHRNVGHCLPMYGIIYQKAYIFTNTVVRTSNLASINFLRKIITNMFLREPLQKHPSDTEYSRLNACQVAYCTDANSQRKASKFDKINVAKIGFTTSAFPWNWPIDARSPYTIQHRPDLCFGFRTFIMVLYCKL